VQKGSEETDLISSRKHSYINNKNIWDGNEDGGMGPDCEKCFIWEESETWRRTLVVVFGHMPKLVDVNFWMLIFVICIREEKMRN
jgi:hypothetical protein